MILINVLPPEFRKRDSGVSPIFLAIVGGALANAAIVALWIYVSVRIEHAETVLEDLTTQDAALQAQVVEVNKLKGQIAKFKEKRSTIFGLLGRKVFIARTLNEFVGLMTNPVWPDQGFQVNIPRLDIKPGTVGDGRQRDRRDNKSQNDVMVYTWALSFKLVGDREELAGAYVKSFFNTGAESDFWNKNGFNGKPVDTYNGDVPKLSPGLAKVVVECPLQWDRIVSVTDFDTQREQR